MADIVQLVENGVKKFLKTHAKAVDGLYPVGAVYISVNAVDPSTLFGGTWERYAQGKVLVGVDESDSDFVAGKTGGEKTHKLVLGAATATNETGFATATTLNGPKYGLTEAAAYRGNVAVGLNEVAPHNNIQPYTTVYMWVRTV